MNKFKKSGMDLLGGVRTPPSPGQMGVQGVYYFP
jgi:hypothetical protein